MTVECILVYDVNTETREGERRLRRVAKTCEGLGTRVQKSVFEFRCGEAQLVRLLHSLAGLVGPEDSIRVYRVTRGVLDAVETIGRPPSAPIEGAVIW